MIDDQDRCEWVNVPSGTSSPGKSQTKDCENSSSSKHPPICIFNNSDTT